MAFFKSIKSAIENAWKAVAGICARYYKWLATSFATLLVLGFVVLFSLSVSEGWRTATADKMECEKEFLPLPSPYRLRPYIEFFVEKEEMIEPVFNGGYFIAFGYSTLTSIPEKKQPLTIKVAISGSRQYGDSTSLASLFWDDANHMLWMRDKMPMAFISQAGSHRMFPFDSAQFAYTVKTEPSLGIQVFRFNNRVPGFYMPCDTVSVQANNGKFKISFEMKRDLLTRITASFLFFSALTFCFAIAIFVEPKSLPTSVASFFFSLWSIRGIFGIDAQAFPTLLDIATLTLCVLILVLLLVRYIVVSARELRKSAPLNP